MTEFTTATTVRTAFSLTLISTMAFSAAAYGQAATISVPGVMSPLAASIAAPAVPVAPAAPVALTASFTDFTSFVAAPASLAQHPAITLAAFSRDIAILSATADEAQQKQFLLQVAALFQDASVSDSAKTTIASGFGQAFKSLAASNADYADSLQETVLSSATTTVASVFATATAEIATADIASPAATDTAAVGFASASIGGDGTVGAAALAAGGSGSTALSGTQSASDTFTTTSSGSFSGNRSGGSTRAAEDVSTTGS